MRILNKDNDQPINGVLIMLTPSEAKELVDKIRQLTSEKGDHLHINDETYMREITMAIYTPENSHSFNHRVINLIEKEI
jgi:hypothetical protein